MFIILRKHEIIITIMILLKMIVIVK